MSKLRLQITSLTASGSALVHFCPACEQLARGQRCELSNRKLQLQRHLVSDTHFTTENHEHANQSTTLSSSSQGHAALLPTKSHHATGLLTHRTLKKVCVSVCLWVCVCMCTCVCMHKIYTSFNQPPFFCFLFFWACVTRSTAHLWNSAHCCD